MKKHYIFLQAIVALLCFASMQLAGQALSGVYTINSGLATGGTNFQTFTDFASAINTNGVSGAVTVNVVANTGPYNEQVTFNQITGATAQNNVIINGNGNLITYNSSNFSFPNTIGFNGTDYFTINNLQVQATGSYAFPLILYSGANYNNFSACTFSVPANSTNSNQIPVVISGAGNNYYTSSNSANYCTFTDCQMYSGYFCTSIYGPTSAPYNGNNTFLRCSFEDYHYYGIYNYYHWNMTFKDNTLSRPTRTNLSFTYNMMIYYTQGSIIDGNRIMKPFETSQTNGNFAYGMYIYNLFSPMPAGAASNKVRNNIICDFKHNGTQYGLLSYGNNDIDHNTISFDYTASTSGSSYGMQVYTYSGLSSMVRDNLISITRGGSGTKYGIYVSSSPADFTINYNNIYVNSTGGTNYTGSNNGANANTFAAWQALGHDAAGASLDPIFANLATNDLHPTNASLNNLGTPIGVIFDKEGYVRHATTPDMGALEFLTPMCSGTPSMTVNGPTYSLCPGETANVLIGNLSSDLGYTYQWQWSTTSVVGPFTVIPGANSITHSQPNITGTTWISAVISCTAPGGGTITAVAEVSVAGTTTNSVPYYEDFEGIGMNNRLPNCSWSAPTMGAGAKTYANAAGGSLLPKSGSAFAAFINTGAATNYYYSNGIWLDAGVTYSASMWYQTDLTGATNWSNLSIHYNTTQSPTGLTQIAAVAPAVSPQYKSLSNIFTVPNSGFYYIAIKAVNSAGGAASLAWDDLSIIIPCTPALNTPTINLSVNNTTVCSGESVILTASGADTYTWSTGANGSAVTEYPQVTTNYYVNGTNALTGCSVSVSQLVTVKPSPVVSVFAFPSAVCAGKPTNLQASGAVTYTWSNGSQGSNINVSPTGNTTYAVMGSGTNNCVGSNSVAITVNPLPNVTGIASGDQICKGDELVLTGNGAVTYQWVSTNPAMVLQGGTAVTTLNASATFTLTGTDANGCQNSQVLSITVDPCTSIGEIAGAAFNLYPNPNSGQFTIELNAAGAAMITVSDVAGRVVASEEGDSQTRQLDISSFAAGVYYVKVQTAEYASVVKIIKQ